MTHVQSNSCFLSHPWHPQAAQRLLPPLPAPRLTPSAASPQHSWISMSSSVTGRLGVPFRVFAEYRPERYKGLCLPRKHQRDSAKTMGDKSATWEHQVHITQRAASRSAASAATDTPYAASPTGPELGVSPCFTLHPRALCAPLPRVTAAKGHPRPGCVGHRQTPSHFQLSRHFWASTSHRRLLLQTERESPRVTDVCI